MGTASKDRTAVIKNPIIREKGVSPKNTPNAKLVSTYSTIAMATHKQAEEKLSCR